MAHETLDRIRFRGEPLADPAAVVTAGRARFTVLTARLVRMEWSDSSRFEDRASYAFPVRRGPVPDFVVTHEDSETVVDTGALRLRYVDDGEPFHPGNLRVDLTGDLAATWHPGDVDHGNLGGARRTVDDCRGEARLEPGLVSRSGWAVHDDSELAVFDSTGWPTERETGVRDWYFFGYGHAYAEAVGEYTRFGGAPAMIPRFVLGAWWSRYHAYDDAELRALVEEFSARDFPLDVVVVDMDWHLTNAWTGYTWNRELFPDPAGFLAWLHARGQKVTLNLHPALGVGSFEAAYPEFAERMDVDPESGDPVPFDITDRAFASNYLELLHHPLEDEGVDFWWMDWQQGRETAVRGMDPLTWLNHVHFEDMHRRPGRRPVDFSRWGGLGSHRYPVGFSGDSFALWGALAFQPRYTAAGANVAYGWWSHDIGGHSGPDDPELYLRWVQFGAVSPVLRLHSNNQEESDRRPWAFSEIGAVGPEIEDLAREAFRLRYALVPYLYTAARTSVETGVSVVRPTAWIDPDHDAAYLARDQYLLGPDLLVAPVVRPVDRATGLADVDVWLPEGPWLDRATGESFVGPRWVRLGVTLDRVPVFVRPGTVLPLAPVTPTVTTPDHLTFEIHLGPGAHDGSARVFDDDGETTDPDAGAWTDITLSRPDPSRAVLTVAPGIERSYTVRIPFVVEPAAVTVDGEPATWRWDEDAVLEVDVPRRATAFTVDVSFRSDLSITGADHDSTVRAADLAMISGGDGDPVAGVLGLAGDSAARALGVARLGGPAVRVLEYTTPDEAVVTLGRVVVAAPEHGPAAEVTVRWTLERDGRVETSDGSVRVETRAEPAVLVAPFAWDGTLDPCRWSVEVVARWGEFEVVRRHAAARFAPALPSWWVGVEHGDGTPPTWSSWTVDPADIDFGSLAQRVNVRFRAWDNAPLDAATVGHAVTTVTVPADREVALTYVAGGEVGVQVDGEDVVADVTGGTAVKYFTLDPPVRRTAAVRLAAGTHTVRFACPAPANLADVDWYLSAWVTDPDGTPLLDVTSVAGPEPRAR